MRRLIRPLTVVIGLLVALGGGGAVLVATGAGSRQPVAARAPAAAGTTPTVAGPATTVAGTSTSAAGTSTTVVPGPATTSPTPLAKLSAGLDAALADTTACLIVDDSRGQPLYQHLPDTALTPASTQKLLVAAAALNILGPNFRFTTSVVAPAAPVGGQVGQLWLVGNGDPLLATSEFTATLTARARVAGYPWTPLPTLAGAVAAAGITSVPGGIHGDDSHLDRLRFLPVWPPAYQTQQEIGLLSALSLNEGIQTTAPKLTLAQDPPAFAAAELGRLLTARHVAAGPAGADQPAPAAGVVIATLPSAPLSQIVEVMLRASDNWIAELLVRQLDRASGGGGTTAGGLTVVMREATALGLPLTGVQMDDGSGLSHTDRATCRELLAALDLSNRPGLSPLLNGLPVAGATGTLAGRYRTPPIAGKLRAKTGSIDYAVGMVGTISVGEPLRFALLVNQVEPEAGLYAREDAVVAALAGYGG